MADSSSSDFSFSSVPIPAAGKSDDKKDNVKPLSTVPLTARSTVVEAASDGSFRAPKPLPARQAFQRQKVALEKGFSQVDWLKLCRTHPDLTGVARFRKDITLAEVKQHNTVDDAWIVLRGKVYNMTHYLSFHPGGVDILLKAAGRDGTALFQKYHPWVNADALLEKCWVGLLAPKPLPSPPSDSPSTPKPLAAPTSDPPAGPKPVPAPASSDPTQSPSSLKPVASPAPEASAAAPRPLAPAPPPANPPQSPLGTVQLAAPPS